MRQVYLLLIVFLCSFFINTSYASVRFLSLSDIHFDPFYSCHQKTPCPVIEKLRTAPASQWSEILAANDVDLPQYHQDSNYVLLQSALSAAKEAADANQAKFVIVLGDYLSHDFRDYYKKYSGDKSRAGYVVFVRKTLAFVSGEIAKTFPNLDVYMAVGNNDSYKSDYVSDPNGQFFNDTAMLWANLIKNKNNHTDLQNNFPKAGYYTVNVEPDLRFIILNTNLFSAKAKGHSINVAAEQELNWLHQQLQAAKEENQKVFIGMHIPMGVDVYATLRMKLFTLIELWKPQYAARFQAELRQFYPEINGIFTGHLHSDWFQILTVDKEKNGEIPATGTPAISPLFGNNPGFKIYAYDDKTKQLENFVTYYNSLSGTRKWGVEYDFNRIYQPQCAVCSLTKGMDLLTRDGELADHFKLFYAVNTDSSPIMTKWYPYYWCAIHEANADDYKKCVG